MVFLDRFFDIFCRRAAVINYDEQTLKNDVKLVKKKYGKWVRVKGFTNSNDLFLALRLAQSAHNPYVLTFIKNNATPALDAVLKKTEPHMQTYRYSDTQNLSSILPSIR